MADFDKALNEWMRRQESISDRQIRAFKDGFNAALSAQQPEAVAGGDVTPLSDVTLLRTLCEDVPDMHSTVRQQLQSLARRIEQGATVGATRCRRCGEKAEVTIHSATIQAQPQVAVSEFPARFVCNGPEGTFYADDGRFANRLIVETFDRDEWTVTDTTLPPACRENKP